MSQELLEILQEVKDPEIPTVSVVELGMINRINRQDDTIFVEMIPTFVGCPALDMIRQNVQEELMQKTGVKKVKVEYSFHPPWTSERITREGWEKLRAFGIASPGKNHTDIPSCPYCEADGGDVENIFGPAACRAIYYCKNCRQPYEGMKKI
ncbi:MAG: 1,2-phenylacetyl-CoA epoxidase subunit PaaD [Thermoactinomyces sp.]